ncbi:MAG: pantetheine-phosphate adenylyltransferase [Nonlabens sp.]|nr:pantetheine-phosphate adenylyltransferase [Nonlabens sp.]MDP5100699.1 pantetheine-phosphate adenylyltransferase [Nonlabens sp.]
MKIAVFPGSFDPVTLGHVDIITRGASLFDELIIAVGTNALKTYTFTAAQRVAFLEEAFSELKNVKVTHYTGLTVDYCKTIGAHYILRGLRNPADFQFEESIAQANKKMTGIDTAFLLTAPEYSFISSSIVRDVMKNGGDYSAFVPKGVSL